MPFKIMRTLASDPAAISPKVTRPAWVALLIAALTGILGALSPEMFAFLGDFAGPAFLVAGAVIEAVVGYLTNDPARSDGKHVETGEPAPHDNTGAVG